MEYFYINETKIVLINTIDIERILLNTLINANKPALIITYNLDFLRISTQNGNFRNLCANTELIFPDGSGIILLLKIRYGKKVSRITGHDIFFHLCSISDQYGYKIALLGSSNEILNCCIKKLISEFPKINIVKALAPSKYFECNGYENEQILKTLSESSPDILLLALGCPRQELWLSENMHKIGAKINMGVGSVFDYYSGFKKRCPPIFQNIHLEWLWRLVHEPKRLFKRYIIMDIPIFIKTSIDFFIQRIKDEKN